jgi:hypothetical protein
MTRVQVVDFPIGTPDAVVRLTDPDLLGPVAGQPVAVKFTIAKQNLRPVFAPVALASERAARTKAFSGEMSGEPLSADIKRMNCIEYVADVLSRAFAALGASGTWDGIESEWRSESLRLSANNPEGPLDDIGAVLMCVLQRQLRWVALFWAPASVELDENDAKTGGAESWKVMRDSAPYFRVQLETSM